MSCQHSAALSLVLQFCLTHCPARMIEQVFEFQLNARSQEHSLSPSSGVDDYHRSLSFDIDSVFDIDS